jgi:hypothetical protein
MFTIIFGLIGLLVWAFTGKPLLFVYIIAAGLAIDIFGGSGIAIYNKFFKNK